MQTMPDDYLKFKSLLRFAFVSSFNKFKPNIFDNLFRYGLHKPSKYLKFKNLLIGYVVNAKKN
jgi:hypothetical protein